MNVSEDFEELLALLSKKNVRALVVGGYAVTFHAKPRFTKDLDILIDPTPENAQLVLDALKDFGFGSLNIKIEDFTLPGRILQLGRPPSRVDFLTSIKAVPFDEAWSRRVKGRFGQEAIFYIGIDDLIRNKEAVGRPQDKLDVATLKRFKKKLAAREES